VDSDLEDLTQKLRQAATISTASDIDFGPRQQSVWPDNPPQARLRKDCKLPIYVHNQEADRYEEVMMDFQFPYRNHVNPAILVKRIIPNVIS